MTIKDATKNFFSGYFHQDWEIDTSTTDEVVSSFVRTNQPLLIATVAADIRDLFSHDETDAQLEEVLFRDLGCYYQPSADHRSARAWLEDVAIQLETAAMLQPQDPRVSSERR